MRGLGRRGAALLRVRGAPLLLLLLVPLFLDLDSGPLRAAQATGGWAEPPPARRRSRPRLDGSGPSVRGRAARVHDVHTVISTVEDPHLTPYNSSVIGYNAFTPTLIAEAHSHGSRVELCLHCNSGCSLPPHGRGTQEWGQYPWRNLESPGVAEERAAEIAMFAIDPDTGAIRSLGQQAGEATPRAFAIAPNGQFLYSGADGSNLLRTFRIGADGVLQEHGAAVDLGGPAGWVYSLAVG